jgi:cation diffusion facilitator CzcD-associated flavoprotein CzcO
MNRDLDVIVVGAGFAGLYMVHKMHQQGRSVRAFEAGSGVGGTWFWNQYPGARCDVESMEYSFGFSEELEQSWVWSERYAPQPEILRYLNHVADRFDLRDDIQLNTSVLSAHYIGAEIGAEIGPEIGAEAGSEVEGSSAAGAGRWQIKTDDGETWTGAFCIMATGCLSSTNTPDIPGLDSFAGEMHHTSRWPHEGVEFEGKRVGVIGTGSSGIQSIPVIAESATHLTVFQRTANYSVPAYNRALAEEARAAIKQDYQAIRAMNRERDVAFGINWGPPGGLTFDSTKEERLEVYERYWKMGGLGFLSVFEDILLDQKANDEVSGFVRGKIRAVVDDPDTARLLSPDHVLGCKRPCVDTNYFQTYNRDNVELVDISGHPIDRITEKGLVTGGREFEFDCLVLATGFDAMTGALHSIDIRGRRGQTLVDKWSAGPITYLGLGTNGFPNFFTITGPGSPSVLTNMVASIEQHVDWISDCFDFMQRNDHATIEATREAEEAWVLHVNKIADETLYPTCNSWYLGANVPGKPRVFMPHIGFPPYVEKCDEVVAAGYQGFDFSSF